MANEHLVVDGSNIATEGRTAPSLAQLNDAVIEFTRDHHFDNVVVVVDATFPNRIDDSERAEFEEAVLAGELLTPPAGAVGRGDAFVLQIANRTGATVLSNDSFQEFHATYGWLFDEDRLWGGKPVPGVGWVFVPRVPVKGPVSRRSFRDARNKGRRIGAGAQATRPQAARPQDRGARSSRPARRPTARSPLPRPPVHASSRAARRPPPPPPAPPTVAAGGAARRATPSTRRPRSSSS